MKILNITAQKPDSTGSGIYLTELVKGFAKLGHEQAVIAGVYEEDKTEFPRGVKFYPLYFKSEKLPFAIPGMSDEMPYESTVYSHMTQVMIETYKQAFIECIIKAADEFCPDIILCHHLYLVTALVRQVLPEKKVYGFCHNTDLRQMRKNPLEREFIKKNICMLDGIFAIHEEQKADIINIYGADGMKISIVGTGYNHHIFYRRPEVKKHPQTLIFAGKLSEKKGVMSLVRSLSYLKYGKGDLVLKLAGGYGNKEEYDEIIRLAGLCPYKVEFLGKLSQQKLAEEYNACDIFVLPSFFEGVPLTVIEAVACGDKVVVTDLPGLGKWIKSRIPGAPVLYVAPPRMKNTDEPVPEDLPGFERALAGKIEECIELNIEKEPDLGSVSWDNICRLVITESGF